MRELAALYDACRRGRAVAAAGAAGAVRRLRGRGSASWLQGEVLERQLAYWREQLAGAPALLELPTDRPRPAVDGPARRGAPAGRSRPRRPSGSQALSRREGATLFMTLLAAFQVLLAPLQRPATTSSVGTPIAGRTRRGDRGADRLLRQHAGAAHRPRAATRRFRELLRPGARRSLGAYEHQDVPFEQLVEELQPERSLSHSPLFQVMFALQNAGAGTGWQLPGVELRRPGRRQRATAKFDLSLSPREEAGRLEGALDVQHRPVRARARSSGWRGTSSGCWRRSRRPGDAAAGRAARLLEPRSARQVLEEWNRTAAPVPAVPACTELFEAQAARTPDARGGGRRGRGAAPTRELNARAEPAGAPPARRWASGPRCAWASAWSARRSWWSRCWRCSRPAARTCRWIRRYPAERLAFMLDGLRGAGRC